MTRALTVLFDGWCNVCSGTVDFARKRDTQGCLQFHALQSDRGRELLAVHGLPEDFTESFVVIDAEGAHLRSTAGLRLMRALGWPWSWLYAFIVVPRPWRDALYDWFGRKRYKWFGRRTTCRLN